MKAEAWRRAKLGEKPRRSWQDATARWLRETSHKASHKDDVMRLRWLDGHLGDLWLDEITRDILDRVIESKLGEGVSNATVNRHLALIRAILRCAVNEWEWLGQMPRIRTLPEPKKRVDFLTQDEAARLAEALPGYLAEPYRFALETGLRQGNVFGLEWRQVDLARRMAWIHPDQAKARKAIAVPLTPEAVLILRRQRGRHKVYCFTKDGKPLKWVHWRAWKDALKRAGITRHVCWHVATRHTWASWAIQDGMPLSVLQELGSWGSPEMVQRYAHLASEHLRAHVRSRMKPRLRAVGGTDLSQ
jgi:integrase